MKEFNWADINFEEYDQQVNKYVDTYLDVFEHICPRCGGEVEIIGMHERDSSGDIHRCVKCKWECGEMAVWNREAELRRGKHGLYGL